MGMVWNSSTASNDEDSMSELTPEILREYLAYDAITGEFTRRISTAPSVKVGDVAGSSDGLYTKINLLGKRYYAHRLAWLYVYGVWPQNEVDHINGDKFDNRIENLREATRSQNCANRPALATSKSGVKGVCWDARKRRWIAQIRVDGVSRIIGHFESQSAAKAAYDAAAVDGFGEYARSA
jgi:hypothetical protein